MKFLKQVVLPIVILLASIAGLTFVTHYTGSPRQGTGRSPLPTAPVQAATFPLQPLSGNWPTFDESSVTTWELNQPGRRDFWFKNTGPAVELGLKYLGCTCSKVDVALLAKKQWTELSSRAPQLGAAVVGCGFASPENSLAPTLIAQRCMDQVFDSPELWQNLVVAEGKHVTIPAARSAIEPTLGVIRLSWEGKRAGRERLALELTAQTGGAGQSSERWETPVVFVPAIRVWPDDDVQLRELTAKEPQTSTEFMCWSSTRPEFPLTVREETSNPCFVFTTNPLGEEECRALAVARNTPVLSGYRVTLQVFERRSEKEQLDLGPFRRMIAFNAGPATDPGMAMVHGVVRGDVKLLASQDPDRLDLGSFAAARGTAKTVVVEIDSADAQLRLESSAPAFLEVRLEPRATEAGRKRWDLSVHVPAGAFAGRLPVDSEVILQLRGPTNRRLRIPLLGNATQ